MGNKTYTHKVYKYIEEEKNSDAVAWAFVGKNNLAWFPFNFPDLNENEIRVAVSYSGLCYCDDYFQKNLWENAQYPVSCGHQVIGVVSSVGSKVKLVKRGERVGFNSIRNWCNNCFCCKGGQENLCSEVSDDEKYLYGKYFGGYATSIQAPEHSAIKIPDNLDDKQAVNLLCLGISVYDPIAIHGNSKCTTLVVGFGPHGQIATKFLQALNFPYAVAVEESDDSKLKEIEKLAGTANIINLKDEEQLKKRKDEFGLVLNTQPHGKYFNTFINLCYQSAIIVQIQAPNNYDTITYNNRLVIKKGIQIEGNFFGSREKIHNMLEFAEGKKINVEIKEHGFESLNKAFDDFQKGDCSTSYVINVKDWAKEHGFYKL